MDNFKFMVGLQAGKVVIMRPPVQPLSKDEALELAAWLCLLAGDVDCERVKALMDAAG
jgi:hypothetical protein